MSEQLEDLKLLRFKIFDPFICVEAELRTGTIGMGLKACELMYLYKPTADPKKLAEACGLTWGTPESIYNVTMVQEWLRQVVTDRFHGVLPPVDSEELFELESKLLDFLILKSVVELLHYNITTVLESGLVPESDRELLRDGISLADADLGRMLDRLYLILKEDQAKEEAEMLRVGDTYAAMDELTELTIKKGDGKNWLN